mmetsp:Transcript_32188/g.74093  ORF Transcript_32188/g.74093 Transcript_32188/m.74093 type:complete len:566 (+) Transcript_32188:8104-9801(+)
MGTITVRRGRVTVTQVLPAASFSSPSCIACSGAPSMSTSLFCPIPPYSFTSLVASSGGRIKFTGNTARFKSVLIAFPLLDWDDAPRRTMRECLIERCRVGGELIIPVENRSSAVSAASVASSSTNLSSGTDLSYPPRSFEGTMCSISQCKISRSMSKGKLIFWSAVPFPLPPPPVRRRLTSPSVVSTWSVLPTPILIAHSIRWNCMRNVLSFPKSSSPATNDKYVLKERSVASKKASMELYLSSDDGTRTPLRPTPSRASRRADSYRAEREPMPFLPFCKGLGRCFLATRSGAGDTVAGDEFSNVSSFSFVVVHVAVGVDVNFEAAEHAARRHSASTKKIIFRILAETSIDLPPFDTILIMVSPSMCHNTAIFSSSLSCAVRDGERIEIILQLPPFSFLFISIPLPLLEEEYWTDGMDSVRGRQCILIPETVTDRDDMMRSTRRPVIVEEAPSPLLSKSSLEGRTATSLSPWYLSWTSPTSSPNSTTISSRRTATLPSAQPVPIVTSTPMRPTEAASTPPPLIPRTAPTLSGRRERGPRRDMLPTFEEDASTATSPKTGRLPSSR